MVIYMAQKIMTARDKQRLPAAQSLYRSLFVATHIYAIYKDDVDTILTTDGYGECIVTA